MFMIGLILKKYPFPEKRNFYIKLAMVLGRTFLVVSGFKAISNDAKEADQLNRCGLP